MKSPTPKQLVEAIRWACSDDTGFSSQAMLLASTCGGAASVKGLTYPWDPADLGRCLRMLQRLPWVFDLAEPVLRELGSPTWRALLDHWSELEELMDDEVGIDWSKGERAPLTYARMHEIRKAAE